MEQEISYQEIFRILKEKNKIIILWSLIGLLLSGTYTFFVAVPMYESSSRIVVSQTQNSNQNITNTDIQTNLNLINTYKNIIKEPIILEDVLNKMDVTMTFDELRNKINVQVQDNSLVFGINIQDDNPYLAADLANAVALSFENKIGEILDVQSVTILSEATPSLDPVSPNTIANLVVGASIGLFVGISFSLLIEFADKRVKDVKFIESMGWINLGNIIEMSVSEINETRINKSNRLDVSSNLKTRRRV